MENDVSHLLPLQAMTKNGTENVETIKVLKALSVAHRNLAELKGYAEVVPN